MSIEFEVESRFTGMFFLLRRLFPEPLDGPRRPSPRPDMGYAVHRPGQH